MKGPAAATVKKPAAATAKKPAAAKKQAAAKKPVADVETVVRVRYTHPLQPVRTYCQAFVDDKWQHVITVAEKEHPEHKAIVHAVGEDLEHGQETFEDSKLRKYELLESWGQ